MNTEANEYYIKGKFEDICFELECKIGEVNDAQSLSLSPEQIEVVAKSVAYLLAITQENEENRGDGFSGVISGMHYFKIKDNLKDVLIRSVGDGVGTDLPDSTDRAGRITWAIMTVLQIFSHINISRTAIPKDLFCPIVSVYNMISKNEETCITFEVIEKYMHSAGCLFSDRYESIYHQPCPYCSQDKKCSYGKENIKNTIMEAGPAFGIRLDETDGDRIIIEDSFNFVAF